MNTSSIQIEQGLVNKFNICKLHQGIPLNYICLNKECPSKNTIQCSECIIKNKIHQDHSEDLITFFDKDLFEKQLKNSPISSYDEITKDFIKDSQQLEELLQKQIEEFIKQMGKELAIIKDNILEKYKNNKDMQLNQEQLLKQQELFQQQLLPINQIKEQLEKLQENYKNEDIQQIGEDIKNIFHSEQRQQKIQEMKDFNKNVQYCQEIKDNIKNKLSQTLNLTGYNNQIKFIGITNFTPRITDRSKLKLNVTEFQNQGILKFESDEEYLIKGNSQYFKSEYLVIFKLKLLNKNQQFWSYFSVQEDVNKGYNQNNGSSICYNDFNHYGDWEFSSGSKYLDNQIEEGDELLILIKPSISLFTIFNIRTNLIIKNKTQFKNLDKNNEWAFVIFCGNEEEFQIINEINNHEIEIIKQKIVQLQ